MAKPFDLKWQLKLHDKGLLQRLFAEYGQLLDFPWAGLDSRDVEPLVRKWETIHETTRRQVQVVLQDVSGLADSRGQRVLAEELTWRFPERLPAFHRWPCLADKALWAYLETREAFDTAAIFARAEALGGGQFAKCWNGLPAGPIEFTNGRKAALEEAIRDYYWQKELRGPVCCVHHYRRPDGAEYFFAYLPDWPDRRLVFNAEGNLTAREKAYTFSNVFIYEPHCGAIELVAKGGKRVQLALRRAFCRTVLGIDVDDDEPLRPTYQLDHLLDPDFSFHTEPADRIAGVHLRQIRLVPAVPVAAVESLEPKFLESISHAEMLEAVDRLLGALGLTRAQVHVARVAIQIAFFGHGQQRGKRMTFHVACLNTCDLKSKPDEVRIVAERCIKRWGILL